MGRKGRSPKVLKQEKAKGLLARSDELDADFTELVQMIPDVQAVLDDTSAPTSLKQEKVNQLANLVGKICTFSALLTPRQANKLQVVQGQIRRFRQSIKRGMLDNPSHTACVDLSTSLNEIGTEVEYSPEIRRPLPPPQPVPEDLDQGPTSSPISVDGAVAGSVPANSGPEEPIGLSTRNRETSNDGLVSSESSIPGTGARPKEASTVPVCTTVALRPDGPVVPISHHHTLYPVSTPHSVISATSSTQVRHSNHDYSVSLDPGDPINAPLVPALQPVMDSNSALVGFTSPERPLVAQQESPDKGPNPHTEKGSQRSRKLSFSGTQKFNQPPPIRSVAFSIYLDPSCRNTSSSVYYQPPNTVPITVYDRPIVYPYRGLPQSGRVPLAPLDQPWSKHFSSDMNDPAIPDPTIHSTPKARNPGQNSSVGFHAVVGAPGPASQAASKPGYPRSNDPPKLENGYGAMVDPFSMDDPGFPDRWRMPPGQILQTMYLSQELGKMWK